MLDDIKDWVEEPKMRSTKTSKSCPYGQGRNAPRETNWMKKEIKGQTGSTNDKIMGKWFWKERNMLLRLQKKDQEAHKELSKGDLPLVKRSFREVNT